MNKPKFSCYGCPDKRGGCHAECEIYKREKAAHEAEKAERDRKKHITQGLNDHAIRAAARNKKRAGRGWNGGENRNVE